MTSDSPRYFVVDRLAVEVHPTRARMGRAAAQAAAEYLRGVIAKKNQARVIFACAPSQDDFLAALVASPGIDWSKVKAFHMDDYVGIAGDHPQSFRRYLRANLLSWVKIGSFHPLPAEEPDSAAVCSRYSQLLREAPIDLICLGIGENGHIAFNDPPVADFEDPEWVKVVELDRECRQQQVNDGCFPTLADVPLRALTLTVPVFRSADRLSIHVPGPRKAAAVRATLKGDISTACPASILRLHPSATLYLDPDSAK